MRSLREPVTLFGETNWMRYKRLKRAEVAATAEIKIDNSKGNVFNRMLKMNADDF